MADVERGAGQQRLVSEPERVAKQRLDAVAVAFELQLRLRAAGVSNPVWRIRPQKLRALAREQALVARCARRVAAGQAMAPEHVKVAFPRTRARRERRHLL